MFLFMQLFTKHIPLLLQLRNNFGCKPRHLICFKQWTPMMVLETIYSAINLKYYRKNCRTSGNILQNCKVMILQEVNQPVLNVAVSKASMLLGASNVIITDNLAWEHDYLGRVFSLMSDVIFVSTSTHMCAQRFANQSTVPVLCMMSRTHASIQALATIMTVIEHFGTMQKINVSYIGAPHQVLNSYLLLCPMLGANFRFKCCCQKIPVHPLLFKASEEMCATAQTDMKECVNKKDALNNACVIISGPTGKKEKANEFKLSSKDIIENSNSRWIFFHTCPRGPEVENELFDHSNSQTFTAFENMQYIAASLMARAIKGYQF